MKEKMKNLSYRAGAKWTTKKAVAKDRWREAKDKGSAEIIVVIAILCIGVLLAIAGRPLLNNIMTALAGRARTAVEGEF